MSDETKPVGLWERTKAWADKNRTISGALVGGAPGRSCRARDRDRRDSWARGLDLPHRRKERKALAAARLIPENAGLLHCGTSAPSMSALGQESASLSARGRAGGGRNMPIRGLLELQEGGLGPEGNQGLTCAPQNDPK